MPLLGSPTWSSPSTFKDDLAYWVNGKEIAHFERKWCSGRVEGGADDRGQSEHLGLLGPVPMLLLHYPPGQCHHPKRTLSDTLLPTMALK